MSKFKNKKSKTLELISKKLTKKGKIKGDNKKETKNLQKMCPHHKLTKKGNVKSALEPIRNEKGDTVLYCPMCKKEIAKDFFSDERVTKTVDDMDQILQQLKFMGTVSGAAKTTDFAAQACVMNSHVRKAYIRTRNVVDKNSKIKNKKKKDSTKGSNAYGSWSLSKK